MANESTWETVTVGEHSDTTGIADEQTDRLRVDGGWIYRTRLLTRLSTVFVPDYDADMERISDLTDLLELVEERAEDNKRFVPRLRRLEDELEKCIDAVLAKR